MPMVQVGDHVVNPLLVVNVESTVVNRTIEEDTSPGLKKQDVVDCVVINVVGGAHIVVEGTGDYLAVSEIISTALDKCLRLCALPTPTPIPVPVQKV